MRNGVRKRCNVQLKVQRGFLCLICLMRVSTGIVSAMQHRSMNENMPVARKFSKKYAKTSEGGDEVSEIILPRNQKNPRRH